MLKLRRQDVGGPTLGLDVCEKKPRDLAEKEPVVFFAMPKSVYRCVMKDFLVDCSINFDPGDFELELVHLAQKKYITSVCWSQTHVDRGYDYLEAQVFAMMKDPEFALVYDVTLANIVNQPATKRTKKDAKDGGPYKKKPKVEPADDGGSEHNLRSKKLPAYKQEQNQSTKADLLGMLEGLKAMSVQKGKKGADDICIETGQSGDEGTPPDDASDDGVQSADE